MSDYEDESDGGSDYEYGSEEESGQDHAAPSLTRAESVGDRTQIMLLTPSGIMDKITKHVTEVSDMLGIDSDSAQVLCHSERWCEVSRLAERWFESPEKVSAEAGVLSGGDICSAAGDATHEKGAFTCPVCQEEGIER